MPTSLLERAARWTATHRDIALDLVRAYVGVALFVRGALLIGAPDQLVAYVSGVDWVLPALVSHYVVSAHLVGGCLLALGLLTRVAALIQMPALAGAVFVVHLREGLLTSDQSLELSALVLFVLALLSVFGAGRLSLDHALLGKPARELVPEPAEVAT
jgi:uncharacterized membrane protein YphA (DoxX/SURF4 family)